MKKILLSLSAIVILAAGIAPYIAGFEFKRIYTRQIDMMQLQMESSGKAKVDIVEYHLGWLKSTIVTTITLQPETRKAAFTLPPMVFKANLVVRHGPVVFDREKNKFTFALARVVSKIDLPDIFKGFISASNDQPFLKINSVIQMDGKTWNNHYIIPALSVGGLVNWGGLNGDATIKYAGGISGQVDSSMQFGQVTAPLQNITPALPNVTINPIHYSLNATLESQDIWNGHSQMNASGVDAKWNDGRLFALKDLTLNMTYGSAGDLYNFNTQTTVSSIQLPAPAPVTSLTDIKKSIAINNLSMSGLKDYMNQVRSGQFKSSDENSIIAALIKLLSPTTNINIEASLNSDAGPVTVSATGSLSAMPSTKEDLRDNVNVEFHARLAEPLVQKIIENGLINSTPPNPQNDPAATAQTPPPAQQAKTIIDGLVKDGILAIDKNDYVITFSKKGKTYNLNGKDITAQLSDLMQKIQQIESGPQPKPQVQTQMQQQMQQQMQPQTTNN